MNFLLINNVRRAFLLSPKYFSTSISNTNASVDTINKSKKLTEDSIVQFSEKVDKLSTHLTSMTDNWEKQKEIYYGKERDMKNFPPLKIPEWHPKVRFGFLPDSWFQAFYNRTGVTGPYLLMWGSLSFLYSKEYIVLDVEGFFVLPFFAAIYVIHSKWGQKMSQYLDKTVKEYNYAIHYRDLELKKITAEKIKKAAAKERFQFEAADFSAQAKHDIIDMQLEEQYRNRLIEVNNSVKKTMQYHIDKADMTRKFQQDYMIDWIVNNVKSSITSQLENQTFKQCIAELKNLAATKPAIL